MRFIDRFTRDDVSAKVWWPFTMLLLVLLVLTFPGEHRAIDARHRATAETDAALGQRVIAPLLVTAPSAVISGTTLADQLTEEIHDEILVNDGRIRAVRIWSPTAHQDIWSSTGEKLGVANALNDGDIDAAVAAAGAPTWVTSDRSPGNAPSPTLYYAYASQGSQPLVAQFEYLDSELTSDVRFAWLGYQIALGVGLLLALVFALLSMREPKARIGTGVPFYPESVPSYLAVMDADRAIAIEQAGDRVKERIGSLQQRLDESETAKRRAEGQLQQALAALATPGRRMPVPAPEAAPEVTPVVRVPEPEPAAPVAPAEPVADAPVAEAPVADAPEPVVAPRIEPAPEPTSEPRAKPIPPPAPAATPTPPAPEPVVVAPRPEPPAPVPEPEPETKVVPEPALEPAAAAASDRVGWPEVVVVPELQPAKHAPAPGNESAADMLDRLVEPVGAHDPSDDPGDLRARLARTAAIKKPGSKERREADEQQHRH